MKNSKLMFFKQVTKIMRYIKIKTFNGKIIMNYQVVCINLQSNKLNKMNNHIKPMTFMKPIKFHLKNNNMSFKLLIIITNQKI